MQALQQTVLTHVEQKKLCAGVCLCPVCACVFACVQSFLRWCYVIKVSCLIL
jgi:hypothetical protein